LALRCGDTCLVTSTSFVPERKSTSAISRLPFPRDRSNSSALDRAEAR
jgi:hypothetical protein